MYTADSSSSLFYAETQSAVPRVESPRASLSRPVARFGSRPEPRRRVSPRLRSAPRRGKRMRTANLFSVTTINPFRPVSPPPHPRENVALFLRLSFPASLPVLPRPLLRPPTTPSPLCKISSRELSAANAEERRERGDTRTCGSALFVLAFVFFGSTAPGNDRREDGNRCRLTRSIFSRETV